MPGRLAFDADPHAVAALFGLAALPATVKPDYNIAPYEAVSVVAASADGSRRHFRARWGLLPRSAGHRDERPAPPNARADKLATSAMYKKSFADRRGLVPASGFYEWPEEGPPTGSAPYYVRRKDRRPFALAAIWDEWRGEFETLISAATIVTEPNEILAAFSRRGPAVIRPEDFDAWLDPATPTATLGELLRPFPADGWEAYRVTVAVNRHGWDAPHGPECIEPAGTA